MPASLTSSAPALDDVSQQSLRLPAGPILVATDGSAECDSAIVAARLLAAHTKASVQVVSALEPLAVPTLETEFVPVAADVSRQRGAKQRQAIHEQLRRFLPARTEWPVTMFNGDAARVLSRTAHTHHTRLLVMGRGRHGLADRLLRGETVLRLLQLSDAPVFAAEPWIAALPRFVLIATDFSPYSIFAARGALEFVDPDATLYLAHVAPEIGLYHEEFERVRAALGIDATRVKRVVLTGDPGRALVDFAAISNADLMISGTHGYGFLNRFILGSVATQLVRGAPCSVLVVPGSAATRAATRERIGRGRTRAIPMDEWSRELTTFSRRNVGRQCTLEIDDPDLGAQVQGNALPFVGAAFDPHGTEVQLMLGAAGLAGRYLSHVVPDVFAVDVLDDEDGRDHVLRVASEQGSTVLTFTD
ncbi:MAG TPA: universal stress protein [Gemmatimonadaceae bacterium]|nr:universal stress protein [Gemmatimonadaceae bacterium]